ncbi:MAG: nitrogenase component 1 [bacterium]
MTDEEHSKVKPEDRLKEFRIPLMNHTRYFGVFMASHSIPDSILVLHKGTGCKMKGSTHIADKFHESFSQVCWTEVTGVDILTDSHSMIEDTALTNQQRRKPGVIAVTTSSVIEMTGFDMREAIEAIQPKAGCPLVYVPTPGYEGDAYDGLADFTMAMAGFVDWSMAPEPGVINIFGYPFERYEMDHGANIRELKRIIEAVGLRPGSWFFSGQKAAQLLAAHTGSVNVVLPYFKKYAAELEKLSGRPSLVQDLPMGLNGTTRWLENVSRAAGADEQITARFIRAEKEKTELLLDIAKRCIGVKKICVIQATPLAAGCSALALELGLELESVILLDFSLGGGDEFLSALARITGRDIPDNINIYENPSWSEISGLPELSGGPAIIISPAIDMEKSQSSLLNIIELGSPSSNMHMIYPMPYLGYGGAIALAQRIMDASASRY